MGESVGRCRAFASLQHGNTLPGQRNALGAVCALQHRLPRPRRLRGIRGANDREARDGAEGSQLFNGLVGGTIFAERDRVVCPDIDCRNTHQRRQPDGWPHVVGENQERAPKSAGVPVQGNTVQNGAHRVLANTEVHHPAVGVSRPVAC